MKDDAREIDELVRLWCLGSDRDQDLIDNIAQKAITSETTAVVPFARALSLLAIQQTSASMKSRFEQLKARIDALTRREWQIDDLGNPDNEPLLLFELLGDDVAGIQGFDQAKIRTAQLSGSTRADSVNAMFDILQWDILPKLTAESLKLAVDDLRDREQHDAWGLFVDNSTSTGWALGIKVACHDNGESKPWSGASNEVFEQVRIALQAVLPGRGWETSIEFPANFTGESLGLPVYIAGLVSSNRIRRHSLTASTGRLDINGRVIGVGGIREKIEAARQIGIRRVLVPRENLDQAKAAAGKDLVVVPVANISEVASAFQESLSSAELGRSGLIRLVRASIANYGLVIKAESTEAAGYRFEVANAKDTANIWVYTNGRVRCDGPVGSARDAAERLLRECTPKDPEKRDVFPFQLPKAELQQQYKRALIQAGAVQESPHQYEEWRMRLSRGRSRASVVLYTSGKCVIQGTAPAWDEAFTAAKRITEHLGGIEQRTSTSSTNNPVVRLDKVEPHIGTDEAGKGDYFGPLVSAAVFVDVESAKKLRLLGVRDSKKLTDSRIRDIAEQIRKMPEVKVAVTAINPHKYNELYQTFQREGKNLNSLLAWGHARSIGTLLGLPTGSRVPAKYVLVDQFADKRYIEERTRQAGIPIHQRPKAEEDIAVAAASILARDGFVRWIERFSQRTQITLPKGASPQVIEAGKQFVRKWGARWLGEVAKLNFRTTAQVLDGEHQASGSGSPQWINEQSESKNES